MLSSSFREKNGARYTLLFAKVLNLKIHLPVICVFSLASKPLDTPLHLTEWSTPEMKDVIDNFSSKVMTEKVLLLKSFTHQNIFVASPTRCDENLSSWRVPPSEFSGIR
ncbi:hypothetical protein HAX54_014129 [Datura stramonium]|uniref:Uncharacterized protein n=1 Tax=Datura stramonium TaxID=4076 RepID=A0ABS8TPI2_DATST|nr:hypothetical protein [Datura stramonium]